MISFQEQFMKDVYERLYGYGTFRTETKPDPKEQVCHDVCSKLSTRGFKLNWSTCQSGLAVVLLHPDGNRGFFSFQTTNKAEALYKFCQEVKLLNII